MDVGSLFDVQILLLIVAVFGVIWIVRKTSGRFKAKWLDPVRLALWKILWLIPVALGVAGALYLPGLFEGEPVGVKILKGVLAGFFALWFRKGFKRIVLEKFGVDIDVDKPGLVGSKPPPTPSSQPPPTPK